MNREFGQLLDPPRKVQFVILRSVNGVPFRDKNSLDQVIRRRRDICKIQKELRLLDDHGTVHRCPTQTSHRARIRATWVRKSKTRIR